VLTGISKPVVRGWATTSSKTDETGEIRRFTLKPRRYPDTLGAEGNRKGLSRIGI
jgi:protocatechuate 3,4-dioxygenase beta subunit